jgi:GNAT superfamily N-acetyltransferase
MKAATIEMQGSVPTNANAPSKANPPKVMVRLITPKDSISEITRLLHRAYKPQVDMGLKPLAGRQGDDITADRAAHSECYLAVIPRTANPAAPAIGPAAPTAAPGPDEIVGVILFEEVEKVTFPPFFLLPHVAHFAQFAVDPDRQGMGIGRVLLEKVEQRARENGATELALSMAEPDTKLREFYDNRGFRLIEYWQWPYTNYRSCILSKPLK